MTGDNGRRGVWELEIGEERAGGVLVVAVAGRLGVRGAGALVEALAGASRGGVRRILCDLKGVDYASSAGLLALDAVSGRICADGGELVLCGLTEPVRLVLELANLLPQFTIAASRDEGLARFGQH